MDIRECVLKEAEIIREFVDEKRLPGACFSVVTPEEIGFSFYGDKALIPERKQLCPETLYDIASLSKVVSTSTMLAKLMEEGLLCFDTRVSSILEGFPYEDITILDLIVHTSGYPADDKNYKLCQSPEELWNFIYRHTRTYQRGTRVEYSCFNYIILGKIIEKLKGSMEDYAREVLFDFLGSENIMYKPAEKGRKEDCAPTEVTIERGVIQGEVHDGKAYRMKGVAGNAGVFGNIEALSLFAQMMLNEGRLHGKQILAKETLQLFKQSYTKGLNESRTMGGWYFADPATSAGSRISDCCLYHTGFSGTSIYIDFRRNCALVLLSNAIHPNRESKIKQIRPLFHERMLAYIDHNQKETVFQ